MYEHKLWLLPVTMVKFTVTYHKIYNSCKVTLLLREQYQSLIPANVTFSPSRIYIFHHTLYDFKPLDNMSQ
jgi:hypothetical protein